MFNQLKTIQVLVPAVALGFCLGLPLSLEIEADRRFLVYTVYGHTAVRLRIADARRSINPQFF
ncbi:hypothetical protein VB780_03440 [Leptolyngbya sp. CCNP1308]|uniref:hypothetical protein n=1 Tax=Leptolyngbya sp. CCNP1308 TaxID=3110255 RepID=UPI002B21C82A|nr:hypothetical protein [Leptolyngbya sp. CCNP1308]MEA5447608.1 hypothetical protein [Leptolyngbya sp. CCNP1308]